MSDTNVTQQVASGESPQPNADAGQDTNLDPNMAGEEVVDGGASDSTRANAAIDAAAAKGQISKAEAQSLKKKLTLKVDGQDEVVEFDPSDEQALVRELQKSRAFDKRSKEFSGFKSQVDNFIKGLRENPDSILEQMGINVDDLAEKRLQRKIQEMQMTPEEREKEKMRAELEELKKEKQRAEQERQQAQQEALKNKYAAEIENDIESALNDSKSKLPRKNPRVIARIAQTMLWASANGYNNVSVKDVLPYVEKEWKEELSSYFDNSAEDLIEELVGKQNLERMRKKRLQNRPKAPTASANQIKDTGKAQQKQELEDKPKTKKMRDIFSIYD